jgi:hypothetical protein
MIDALAACDVTESLMPCSGELNVVQLRELAVN